MTTYSFHHSFRSDRAHGAGGRRQWSSDARLDPRLARSVAEIRDAPRAAVALSSERILRASAATVANARPDEISATRVAGVLGLDDLSAFEAFVARLVEEYKLEASVRVQDGTFAVRFCRPPGDN
jgi:hypothetical protein